MAAIPAPRAARRETSDRGLRAAVLLAFALLLLSFQAAAQEQKTAVWKAREVNFTYRSSAAIYSCSALQGRVATVLRAIGARDDVAVRVSNCDEFIVPPDTRSDTSSTWDASGIPNTRNTSSTWQTQSGRFGNDRTTHEQQVHVHIRLMMPVVVTPEVLAELDRDKSRRELISRVTGNPAAMNNDAIVFSAQRQLVTLSHESIGLEPAECELVEQMSTSVFRQLDVRVVRRNFFCNRNQVSRIRPQLTVETLAWTPPAAGARLPQMPAAGESDAEPSAPAASDNKPSE